MFKYNFLESQIKNTVKFLLKTLFRIDVAGDTNDFLETKRERESFKNLQDLVDQGEVNLAENELFELEDEEDLSVLKIGLLFYYYLNSLSEAFLFRNNFSREEINMGLQDLISEYGLEEFIELIKD